MRRGCTSMAVLAALGVARALVPTSTALHRQQHRLCTVHQRLHKQLTFAAALTGVPTAATSTSSTTNSSSSGRACLSMRRQGEGSESGGKGPKYTKSNLPSKVCATCGRPFEWRKKWAAVWSEVKYCSDRCRNARDKGAAAAASGGDDGVPPQPPPRRAGRRAATAAAAATTAPAVAMPRRRLFTAAAAVAVATALARGRPASAADGRAPRPMPAEVAAALRDATWDDGDSAGGGGGGGDSPPFSASDFARLDTKSDSVFYSEPKLVEHIDGAAVAALAAYYERLLLADVPRGVGAAGGGGSGGGGERRLPDVLDLCASHVSHLPAVYSGDTGAAAPRVAGLGMNEEELELNKQLTERVVHDLNADPSLPYADGSFDAVVCALSIDYLTRPLQVLREVGRVLRPGGTAAIVFSDRLFLTKAVGLWTGASDIDHVLTVGDYFHYCGGGFGAPAAEDLLAGRKRDKDPLYAVTARKV